jgi:hypothetical protein
MIGTEVSAEDEGNSCSSFVITRMCSHGPSRI